jgi:hypothetical protein
MKPRIKSAGENHTPTTSRSLTAKASSPTSANLPKLKFKNYRKGSQSLRVLPRKDPKSPPQDLARSITMQTLSYGSPPTVARSVVRPQFGASIYDFPSSPTPTANQNTAASIYDFRDDDFEAPTAVRRKTSRFAYGKETGKTIVSPEY